jgi:hypothetical protein
LAERRVAWEKNASPNSLFAIDTLSSIVAGRQPPRPPWAAKLASRGKFLRKIASAELSILKTSILHHGGQPNILARDRPRYFFEIGFTLVLVAPGTHIRL